MTPRLVIFDCDGVLIDSEPIASRVTARLLTSLGWPMAAAEANRRFLGMSMPDMRPIIESRIGPLAPGFEAALSAALITALSREAEPIPGAADVLCATAALGLPYRVASNSSRAEMATKFATAGLARLVADRLHSFEDVLVAGGRGKPAPDLYLAAASAEGVPPASCLVVEDSVPGVQGAVGAGMTCFGFAPKGDAVVLQAAGAARVLRSLAELPPILRELLRSAA